MGYPLVYKCCHQSLKGVDPLRVHQRGFYTTLQEMW